jgi:hypothetical protein
MKEQVASVRRREFVRKAEVTWKGHPKRKFKIEGVTSIRFKYIDDNDPGNRPGAALVDLPSHIADRFEEGDQVKVKIEPW